MQYSYGKVKVGDNEMLSSTVLSEKLRKFVDDFELMEEE